MREGWHEDARAFAERVREWTEERANPDGKPPAAGAGHSRYRRRRAELAFHYSGVADDSKRLTSVQPPIDDFLDRLQSAPGVEIRTTRMSTFLYGEYDTVMSLLARTMKESHQTHSDAAFVYKVLPGATRSINGYD